MAKPCRKLQDYLAHRHVFSTPWPYMFEVIDTAGTARHRVFLTSPLTGICFCKRGQFDQPCRHLLLVLIRRGGLHDAYTRAGGGSADWRSFRRRVVAA